MHPPTLQTMDWIGPAIGAGVFVLIMSFVKRRVRLRLNAVLAAGAAGVYLSGGLGPWELVYPAIATPLLYFAIESFPLIGVAWLLHAAWDAVHHFYGNPIWPFMATSSFGCLIFDSLIAIWFLFGAPSFNDRPMHANEARSLTREEARDKIERRLPASRPNCTDAVIVSRVCCVGSHE